MIAHMIFHASLDIYFKSHAVIIHTVIIHTVIIQYLPANNSTTISPQLNTSLT